MEPNSTTGEGEIRAAIDAGESDGYPSDDAHAALTDLMAEVERLRDEWRKADDGWIAAMAENERLRAALDEFGRHKGDCARLGASDTRQCDCGYSDARGGWS